MFLTSSAYEIHEGRCLLGPSYTRGNLHFRMRLKCSLSSCFRLSLFQESCHAPVNRVFLDFLHLHGVTRRLGKGIGCLSISTAGYRVTLYYYDISYEDEGLKLHDKSTHIHSSSATRIAIAKENQFVE